MYACMQANEPVVNPLPSDLIAPEAPHIRKVTPTGPTVLVQESTAAKDVSDGVKV